jgi:hypothetical protein
MSRLLAVLPVIAALLTFAPAAPVPKEKPREAFYYSTQVGTKWVYQTGDGEFTEVITAVEEKDGAKVLTIGREDNGKVSPWQKLSVSGKGLVRLAIGSNLDEVKPSLCLLKLPVKAGNEWETPGTAPGPEMTGKMTAHGPETVKVPAGTFNVIRVEWEWKYTGRRDPYKATFWYAPEIGLVKLEHNGVARVLKSFTLR